MTRSPERQVKDEQGPRDDVPSRLQQAGLLTAIPFVLLVGPVLGYYLGTALDRRWPWAPWGLVLSIALGFVASGRVTVQFIRRAKALQRDD